MSTTAKINQERLTLEGKELAYIRKRLIDKYPPKVVRKRDKQIVVNRVEPDGNVPEIQSNVRTIPGLISQRGCCYAGCKGVVLGPTRDVINITHGPVALGTFTSALAALALDTKP